MKATAFQLGMTVRIALGERIALDGELTSVSAAIPS